MALSASLEEGAQASVNCAPVSMDNGLAKVSLNFKGSPVRVSPQLATWQARLPAALSCAAKGFYLRIPFTKDSFGEWEKKPRSPPRTPFSEETESHVVFLHFQIFLPRQK